MNMPCPVRAAHAAERRKRPKHRLLRSAACAARTPTQEQAAFSPLTPLRCVRGSDADSDVAVLDLLLDPGNYDVEHLAERRGGPEAEDALRLGHVGHALLHVVGVGR